MFATHHCRHCGDPHQKFGPHGIRRRKPEWVLEKTREIVFEQIEQYKKLEKGSHERYLASRMFKEKIALRLKCPPHQVAVALHKLNLEGLVHQPVHLPPHDSTRDRWGGWDSAWMADMYFICTDKYIEDEETE